jgi:hypothetical protein
MRPVDAAVLELLGDAPATICGVMGVPPAMVGTLEFANYANMDAQAIIFHELKIAPIWRRLESVINNRWLPLWTESGWRGLTAKFDDFKSLFIARVLDERLTAWTAAVRAGIMTVNEVRAELLGLDPLDWGDGFWSGYGTVDLSKGGGAGGLGLLGYYPRAVKAGAKPDAATKLSLLMKSVSRRSRFSDEQLDAVWRSFDALEASWRKRYAKEMAKTLVAVRDELARALPEGLDRATAPEGLEDWMRRREVALEAYAARSG